MPGYVYILTNWEKTTLYTGVTTDLTKRVLEHKAMEGGTFTEHYKTHFLVYAEFHADLRDAIKREKQIKKWKRSWKDELIATTNPDWLDLHSGEPFGR